jgi:hypothetical protein
MKRSLVWFFALVAMSACALIAVVVLLPDPLNNESRVPASISVPFITASKPMIEASEIDRRTGIPALRSRAVVIDPDVLLRQRGQELKMKVELFTDIAPIITFKVLSGFDVNEGMHSGFASDDPKSRAELTTANGMLSGFITYRGKKYRIVADPQAALHYVVEEK